MGLGQTLVKTQFAPAPVPVPMVVGQVWVVVVGLGGVAEQGVGVESLVVGGRGPEVVLLGPGAGRTGGVQACAGVFLVPPLGPPRRTGTSGDRVGPEPALTVPPVLHVHPQNRPTPGSPEPRPRTRSRRGPRVVAPTLSWESRLPVPIPGLPAPEDLSGWV